MLAARDLFSTSFVLEEAPPPLPLPLPPRPFLPATPSQSTPSAAALLPCSGSTGSLVHLGHRQVSSSLLVFLPSASFCVEAVGRPTQSGWYHSEQVLHPM